MNSSEKQPHRIRLRGPWERRATEDDGCDGRVEFQRHFHCPTGLSAADRVELVIEPDVDAASVRLNELPLGEWRAGETLWRRDVTSLLLRRNLLAIALASTAERLGGEVRLEIFSE